MKVSMSKFYESVTGKNSSGRGNMIAAFKRWGLPDLPKDAKGDCIDISYLGQAKAAWTREEEEAAKSRKVGSTTVGGILVKMNEMAQRIEKLEIRLNRYIEPQVYVSPVFPTKK